MRGAAAFEARFNVSRETSLRLVAYEALLRKWQQKINLVGPATLDAFWARHAADSAQLWSPVAKWFLARSGVWLDLGSGGGLPGLIIAILAGGAAERVHLVESDQRKCAFLAAVMREIGLGARVHNCRAEALAAALPANWPGVDIVSARALAPLPRLLEWAVPFCRRSTLAVFPKGRDWARELAAVRADWQVDVDILPSITDEASRILHLRDIKRK